MMITVRVQNVGKVCPADLRFRGEDLMLNTSNIVVISGSRNMGMANGEKTDDYFVIELSTGTKLYILYSEYDEIIKKIKQ